MNNAKSVKILFLVKESTFTEGRGDLFRKFINLNQPPKRTDVEILEINSETKKQIKEKLFKQQEEHCNGCQEIFKIYHLEIDHIVPKAKGGGGS